MKTNSQSTSVDNSATNSISAKPSSAKKRAKFFSLFFILLILIGAGVFAYWLLFLKGVEKTEDAYVSGNQVMVSAQVNGNVKQINVDNMDFVQAGDVLIELDRTDLVLAFEQAQQNLASSIRQVRQLTFNVKQLEGQVKAKTVALQRAQGDLARREQLARTDAIDKESLQHARQATEVAQAELVATQNQLSATQALLLNSSLTEQPDVQKAISNVKQTWLNLQRSQILAPISGYVARRSAQVGQKVAQGSPLLVIISPEQLWIDANFKETQLRHMQIGQPVDVEIDLYGNSVKFDGKVSGIEMGTGSAFSLLPAQNATGNWIKVVQRVPVRIELAPEQLAKYPLRIGLSALVTVNVADKDNEQGNKVGGKNPKVLGSARQTPLAQTQALDYNFAPVEQLIEQIIQQNQQ